MAVMAIATSAMAESLVSFMVGGPPRLAGRLGDIRIVLPPYANALPPGAGPYIGRASAGQEWNEKKGGVGPEGRDAGLGAREVLRRGPCRGRRSSGRTRGRGPSS